MQSQDAENPSVVLKRMIDGYRVSQAIHVAAKLGIADLLKDGPRSSDDLAQATGTHPPTLYRLLRALASAGIFHEADGRRFSLTPLGECLRSDAPEPLGPWATFVAQPEQWEAWAHLADSVRTGENAFRIAHGISSWQYRAQRPEQNRIFNEAQTTNARRLNAAILAAFDFSPFRLIVDVGGGQGAMLAGILARNPPAQGILFDQPHVVSAAEPLLSAAGVADRCSIVGGSFFEAVPGGGDAYIVKFILHDWDDERAVAILQSCRAAIAPSGTLLVIEREVSPPNEGAEAKFSDLLMLVGPGGRERTREEYASLLAKADFQLIASHETASEVRILEAQPV